MNEYIIYGIVFLAWFLFSLVFLRSKEKPRLEEQKRVSKKAVEFINQFDMVEHGN